MNYSILFFDTVTNLVGFYFAFRLFHLFLRDAKKPPIVKHSVCIGVWLILWSINTFAKNPNLNTVITLIMYFFLVTILYNGSLIKRILTIISTLVLSVICEGIIWFIAENFSIIPQNYTLGSALSTLLYIFLILMLERFHDLKSEFSLPFRIYMVFIAMLIGTFFLCDMLVNENIQRESSTMIALAILCLINLLIYYMLNQTNTIYQKMLRQQSLRKQHELYANQLKITRESRDRIHSLNHDMKNHCLALKGYLQNKEIEKASAYINTMTENMASDEEYVNTGNLTLDAVLNHFLHRAHALDASVEIKLSVPTDAIIQDYDLNIVLGNLLENALDAIEQVSDRTLRITVTHNIGILYIEVRNSFNGNLRKNGNTLLTTKKQGKHHGYGVKNIRNVVEKYNGYYKYHVENDLFISEVSLYPASVN